MAPWLWAWWSVGGADEPGASAVGGADGGLSPGKGKSTGVLGAAAAVREPLRTGAASCLP